eukprot:11810920-Alexandrium_andersonii.AAC.1
MLPIAFMLRLHHAGRCSAAWFLLMHADWQHAVAANLSPVDSSCTFGALDRSIYELLEFALHGP